MGLKIDQLQGQGVCFDQISLTKQNRSFDDVSEFAEISRPIVMVKYLPNIGLEALEDLRADLQQALSRAF